MNTYQIRFWVTCPSNGKSIEYALEIKTKTMIQVEDLMAFLSEEKTAYHEPLADRLAAKFGGVQTMTANHHGVQITTERSK